jgi:hypothetical protein
MQNHRPGKARQGAKLGSPWTTWTLTRSHHASLPVSKCLHLDNSQRPHCGYSRILSPQLSNATAIIHRSVINVSQRHDGRFPESSSSRPIASVGDDTISALADLATIFKLKLKHDPSPETRASPATVAPRPSIIPLATQILNSPIPSRRQRRSQTKIHTNNIPYVPLLPRVVTPRTLHHSPPRVPTGSQRLSPRNLSQDDLCVMDSAHMAIDLEHCSQRQQANTVIHPVTIS